MNSEVGKVGSVKLEACTGCKGKVGRKDGGCGKGKIGISDAESNKSLQPHAQLAVRMTGRSELETSEWTAGQKP